MKKLFQDHIQTRLDHLFQFMDSNGFDQLLVESGFAEYYYLDDQPAPFRSNPWFLYFCPAQGPGHYLLIEKGVKKPTLYFYKPDDFWHEVSTLTSEFWESAFNVKTFNDQNSLWMQFPKAKASAKVISPKASTSLEKGFQVLDDHLLAQMNWWRGSKTEYEIECLKLASQKASAGHLAAKESFFAGGSEMDIFNAYLMGSKQRETDLPYGNIVGLDKNSAVLHYQFPKAGSAGKTFLIDAGARVHGYCSDITRTYFTEDAHPTFKALHSHVEHSQKRSISLLKPGVSYVDLHKQSCKDVIEALREEKIVMCSSEEAFEKDLFYSFFPHGLGHPLGIQVHDVGAKQKDASGSPVDQPKKFPFLRTLRDVQENDVLTIEPGLYFIPMLLKELKDDASKKDCINWSKVEELIPFGGIRIEDNVVVRKSGNTNLTRMFLDN